MLHGKTRLVKMTSRIGGKTYDRFLIHIPSKMAGDSQFPFKAGEALSIEVDPKKRRTILSRTSPSELTWRSISLASERA